MKSGVGSAAIRMPNGLVVAAVVAVNAIGDVINPATGRVVAGVLNPDGTLADARQLLRSGALVPRARPAENTTIAVVATNAKLTKDQVNRMALMADDGLARTISQSELLEKIKKTSSAWIKTQGRDYASFFWQAGYGAFSIGYSQLNDLVR